MKRYIEGHIDRSTGQNKRVKVTQRDTHGGPERSGGRIVRGGRLAHQRARATRAK